MAEGRTYRELEQESLGLMAQQHLRDPRRSIQEVAHMMGFAHPSAFFRAFKRWTGTTPCAFREQQQGNES